MKLSLDSILNTDYNLKKYIGIKNILLNVINSKFSLLFFISPGINLKAKIIKSFIDTHTYCIPKTFITKFNLLALDFNSKDILSKINTTITKDTITYIFAYYAKTNCIDNRLLKILKKGLSEKSLDKKYVFYINMFLCKYFTDEKNFDSAEKKIKFTLEYIKKDIFLYGYDKMIFYYIFANFISKTKSYFDNAAPFYYSISENIAINLNDFITLNCIYNKCCYYYNYTQDEASALKYSKRAVLLSNKLDIPLLKFYSYKNFSITYLNRNDFKNAFFYLKQTISITSKINDIDIIECARLQNTLGFLYYTMGNFKHSIKCYLKAFTYLYKITSVSNILDESIKTFNNLSTSFKMLGNIDKSIYFSKLATRITKNISFKNRTLDIYTLSKQYIKLSILYGFFLDDYNTSLNYFKLSKNDIDNHSKDDIYIMGGLNNMLNAYFEYKNNNLNKSKIFFIEGYNFLSNHCKNNIHYDSLLIHFCIYFSKVYKNQMLLYKALSLSKKLNLKSHYKFYKNYFISKKSFSDQNKIKINNFAFNFVLTLSAQRNHAIIQNKKANKFTLLENFLNKTSLMSCKRDLFLKAFETFKAIFFAQGFTVTEYTKSKKFITNIYTCIENKDYYKKIISKDIESFIQKKDLFLKYKSEDYNIFSNDTNIASIKSIILYYIYDSECSSTYFFTIFNDYNSSWILTDDEAKTALVLIKNIFLKLKNIQYTEKIKEQSLTDSLTRLHNSKYLWSQLEKYINYYNKTNTTFSMAMMDINHFKNINDAYGHIAGDNAIKFFSELLRIASNSDNEIIRYGGDEFVIIFPNLKKEKAYTYILELKHLCEKQSFRFNNTEIKINFAFGLSEFNKSFSSKEDFFHTVDISMYNNKKSLKKFTKSLVAVTKN